MTDIAPPEAAKGQRLRSAATYLAIAAAIAACVVAILVGLRQPRPDTNDTDPPTPYAVVYPPEGDAPLRVRLDATGSTDNVGVTAYHWDFDDGTTGEGAIVDHVYPSAGHYHPRLIVEDAAGLTRSLAQTIDVTAPARDRRPPTARISASAVRGKVPLTISLDGSASSDDRGVTLYRWHFDDGSTIDGAKVDHTFILPGQEEVSLTVADAAGHTSEAFVTIEGEVGPPSERPVAAFTALPDQATAPAEVQFDARGSHDDRGIIGYHWEFGDGSSAWGERVGHRYSHAGRFLTQLIVYDDSGLSARVSRRIYISEPPAVTERVLFDDAWAQGIAPQGDGVTSVLTENAHAGRSALLLTPQWNGSYGIQFEPTSFDAYDRLGFWLDSEMPEAVAVRAIIENGSSAELGPLVPVSTYLLPGAGGALLGVWRRAAIPLAALGADHKKIAGFVWQGADGKDLSDFMLDDVSLLPPDVSLPVLSECAVPPPIRGFVERRDGMLMADGVPFRAVGANLYYVQQELSRHVQTGEIRPLAHVRSAFSAAVCAGVNVVRILGFNDSPPETQDSTIIQTAPGVLREEGLRGLDLALAEARAQHLRIILTLTNNWSAFGGIPRYAEWAHDEPADAMDDPRVREWVVDYARMLAQRVNTFTGIRYRDDPTILAVELANELRCRDCESGHDATAFALALAHGVAAAWPNHLIADGGEGFDDAPALYPGLEGSSVVSGEEGASFHTLAQAPEIDLVSYHLYPESWGLTKDQAIQYIDSHEAIAHAAGKIAYMGEFGLQTDDGSRAGLYDQWLHRLFVTDGGSLALVWQLVYPSRPDNDGFALIPGESGQSMAALARSAQILTDPDLDGVSLALFRK